jgi:hypothetical protein
MAGYIGSKSSVTQVDGYTEAEADAEFVNDPNGAITVDGDNVGIGTSSPDSFGSGRTVVDITGSTGGYILTDDGTTQSRMGSEGGVGYLGTRTNHPVVITTNNAERMRIDSSGNVGIGTSSPSAVLDVRRGDEDGKIAEFHQSSGYGFDISSSASVATITAGYNQAFTFETGTTATERMRIDSSGRMLLGTSGLENNGAPTGGSTASGSAYLKSERNTLVSSCTNTAGSYEPLALVREGSTGNLLTFWYTHITVAGSIATNGTSVSYNTSSDYRLKEDWVPMVGASERVLDLKPVNFAWKVDGSRVDGFLAHELQEVVPEAATGTKDAMMDEEYEVTPAVEATYDEDGNELTAAVEAVMGTRSVPDYQGIDQSKLVPLLTAALQEALAEITSLKTRVQALEDV